MTRRSSLPFSGTLIALLALLLLVPLFGTAAHADPADPSAPADSGAAAPETPAEVAEEALKTVEELVDPATPATVTNPGDHPEGKDLTLALLDLATTKDDLPRDLQDDAAGLLARPTDAGCAPNTDLFCYSVSTDNQYCNATLCVHYTKSGDNAVPSEDNGPSGWWSAAAGPNSVPDYVEFTLYTVTAVQQRYLTAGYRPVVSDESRGGDSRTDIYLGDIDTAGYYGYCNTDSDVAGHGPATGYCVLDNDYQYLPGSAPNNLRVTAAHEFFHAVQFAYDVNEDRWLLEATATWVEDEVFDSINDNRQFLQDGPIGVPHRSLDSSASQYGSWIFFRFLSERYPTLAGGLPVIVRQIWERAGAGQNSLQAINSTLVARGTSVGTLFSRFVVWNRLPARYYSEGSAYRPAPLRASYKVSAAAPRKTVTFTLDHLAAKHLRFVPRMTGAWKLRMRLNLNSSAAGGSAMVTYKPKGKAPVVKAVTLSSDGNGLIVLPFGGRVDWVEVAAVNGSIRYPRDNGINQGIIVRAVRG